MTLEAALDEAAAVDRPAGIALMRVLMEAPGDAAAREAFRRALAAREAAGDAAGLSRLRALLALWDDHPGAWRAVRGTIEGIAHQPRDASPDGTLDYWAAAFDRLVAASPEASVALYSLGSADLLAAATAEVVGLMEAWGLLGPSIDLLDLGCGIGRFAAPLAARVRSYRGLDLSPGMVAEARRRHAAMPAARFDLTGGRDLAAVATASLDTILAADVFPYLVAAGGALVDAHLADVARILRPGGRLLILNYAYRGDEARDIVEATAAAQRAGLAIDRAGGRDFRSWDAVTFLLRRP